MVILTDFPVLRSMGSHLSVWAIATPSPTLDFLLLTSVNSDYRRNCIK